ncbi:MAG: hypothetical protein K6F90_01755 [Lachnospiraceae bacterium]|nr:hypothetical protein [Lachnospiraceae bacterium]
MPNFVVNNLTSVKKFAELFLKSSANIPESVSEEYGKMGLSLLAITKKGITDEMFYDFCDSLQGLQELLTKKVDGEKRVVDILTEGMTPLQKVETAVRFGTVVNATKIDAGIADIFYPDAKLEIDGVSYTKDEFRRKMYDNHWTEGEDDKIIDAIYDSYIVASERMIIKKEKKLKEKTDDLMRKIINVPLVAAREKTSKKNVITEVYNSVLAMSNYNGNYRFITNYKNGITDDMVAKESNDDERAVFIRRLQNGQYNRPGDEELLKALFDGRFDKYGNYDKHYQSYAVNKLLPFDSAISREKKLSDIKDLIERNIPENERTEHHKKALAEIDRQLKDVIPVMKQEEIVRREQQEKEDAERKAAEKAERELNEKAQAFQKKVHDNNFWYHHDIYADMYKVGLGLPEDHPFNKLLDNLSKGITERTPEKKIRENGWEGYQTQEELDEAQRILKGIENKTPEMNKIIDGIDEFRKEYANKIQKQKDGYVKETTFEKSPIYQNRSAFNDIQKAINYLDDKDKKALPGNYREYRDAFYTLAYPPRLFGLYRYDKIEKAEKFIADNAVEFFGSLTTDTPLYQKGIEVIEKVWPDLAEQTKALATAKTNEVRRLHDEEVLAGKVSDMSAVKNTLDGIKKAYFNHDNSPEYDRFVRAVTASANAKTLDEYNSLKKELVESATKYLDHTGLDRASKYHDNAEMRRLCAFQVISMAGAEDVITDYLTRANELRNSENKVTKDRLDKLVINGGKEKTSAKELLKEDRETFRKENADKKTKAVQHKENDKNIKNPELGKNNK